MSLKTKIVKVTATSRLRDIDYMRRNGVEVQAKGFKSLAEMLSKVEYGKRYNLSSDISYENFSRVLPIVDYDDITVDIERHRRGENNILSTENICWYAKSSGTTGAKSKYIPVTPSHMDRCHYRGMRDVINILHDNYEDIDIMKGRTLTLGGSHTLDEKSITGARYGDLSAILLENAPSIASFVRSPDKSIALIADFEHKVNEICRTCVNQNITSIAGVPSWNLVLLNKVLEYTGKSTISEVWEDIEVFMHGGVSFLPYREEFNRIIGKSDMKYIESYNASEGFFAIQDEKDKSDMLLMLDYGVFYEFLPANELSNPEKAVPLEGVKCGENYAMLISTLGGLWRYMIGDTVKFTSVNPYKIKITGRTKLYINAFGEEIIVDNANIAIAKACEVANCEISEFTAAPIFMGNGAKGTHQWLIEFRHEPEDINLFTDTLDETLMSLNSDYEAKRTNNTTLMRPEVVILPQGTFIKWMADRGKLGGQNKVPRLANDRKYADEILELIK